MLPSVSLRAHRYFARDTHTRCQASLRSVPYRSFTGDRSRTCHCEDASQRIRGGRGTLQPALTELGRSGPVPLAELSRRIGFDKSWTSRAVEHLVQDGLVEKVPSETDHRMVRISLTAVGEQRLRDLNWTLNGLSERVLERIPASEHEGIERSLTLLLAALQAEVHDPPTAGESCDDLVRHQGEGADQWTCG